MRNSDNLTHSSHRILPFPEMAVIEPTMRCNLACWFCYQNELRTRKIKDLSISEWAQVIDHLVPEIKRVRLIGGEVFAYKPIFKIFELLAERGVAFGFTTNATLLTEEKIQILLGFKPHFVSMGVSIDGPKLAHDAIRGEGNFDRAIAAIRRLTRPKRNCAGGTRRGSRIDGTIMRVSAPRARVSQRCRFVDAWKLEAVCSNPPRATQGRKLRRRQKRQQRRSPASRC